MKSYAEFEDEMILRDYLAYDRTRLALTRTLLSFIRTALGLLASGAGLIILQDDAYLIFLGYGLIAAATAVFAIGIVYCLRTKARLDKLE